MESLAKFFNHDFKDGAFELFDSEGNQVYFETIDGYWDKKETYSAVVESGFHSDDYKRWHTAKHCGHKHRTIEAAEKCLGKQDWWLGTIHNQDGERVREG